MSVGPCVIPLQFGKATFSVVPAPPPPPQTVGGRPLHVVIVMDISGSMQLIAAKKNANGEEEKFANSVLDLVKYASKAIYGMLTKDDLFSLVVYGSTASLKLECVAGGDDVSNTIDSIHESGCTNMGAGLKLALDCVLRNDKKAAGRQAAVMLLTDGAPNEGQNAAEVLQAFKLEQTELMSRTIVNTYAFGYASDLAGELMFEIATKGNGSFGYIPDVGFLGTVFIHSMINLRSTVALLPHIQNVQVEQVRCGIAEVVFTKARSGDAGNDQSKACTPTAIANTLDGKTTVAEVRAALEPHSQQFKNVDEAVAQVLRGIHAQKACCAILECIGSPNRTEAQLYKLLEKHEVDLSAVPNLAFDIEQQVAPAFRPEYFVKWGKQYLLSFVSAHLHQQCNNFKDKSVEAYKTPFALALHTEYDDIFNLLEPPKPTVHSAATVQITSSRQFNSSRDPCVHQDSRVLLANGAEKAAREVVPGDMVRTANGMEVEVDHIIRTQCRDGKSQMVCFPGGLRITPWHPVLIRDVGGLDEWALPCDLGFPVAEFECEFVYSFTVKKGTAATSAGYEPGLMIDGVPVVHLAHERTEPALLKHAFFGTSQVVDSLPKSDNRVHTFAPDPVHKGSDGVACGWDMTKYIA